MLRYLITVQKAKNASFQVHIQYRDRIYFNSVSIFYVTTSSQKVLATATGLKNEKYLDIFNYCPNVLFLILVLNRTEGWYA